MQPLPTRDCDAGRFVHLLIPNTGALNSSEEVRGSVVRP
jgi:hypothetical protein